jgi:hypothetical protein
MGAAEVLLSTLRNENLSDGAKTNGSTPAVATPARPNKDLPPPPQG